VLPYYDNNTNQFINDLYVGSDVLWIGTENGLYNLESNQLNKVSLFNHVSIKSLEGYIDGKLLIGTDNGLFIWNSTSVQVDRITHDSRNAYTLANNIIWRTYVDDKSNIWIGTETGFSIWRPQSKDKYFPIYAFANSNDGNNFYNIFH
jgi:ligand-binding sensor domain-containing protein